MNFLIDHLTVTITGSVSVIIIVGLLARHFYFRAKHKNTEITLGTAKPEFHPEVDASRGKAARDLNVDVEASGGLKADRSQAGQDINIRTKENSHAAAGRQSW